MYRSYHIHDIGQLIDRSKSIADFYLNCDALRPEIASFKKDFFPNILRKKVKLPKKGKCMGRLQTLLYHFDSNDRNRFSHLLISLLGEASNHISLDQIRDDLPKYVFIMDLYSYYSEVRSGKSGECPLMRSWMNQVEGNFPPEQIMTTLNIQDHVQLEIHLKDETDRVMLNFFIHATPQLFKSAA